jgi:small subunit ribosomal protein S20
MANHVSAEKRNRQRIVRTARNRALRTGIKSSLKKARAALESGDPALAKDSVGKATSVLARAVSKGVVHRKTASRTIGRINAQLAALGRS